MRKFQWLREHVMKQALSAAAAAACIFLFQSVASAQIPLARPGGTAGANPTAIVGTVADSASQPLSGAAITVKNGTGQATLTGSLADTKGKFRIEGLAPGKYHLHISYIGYKPHEQDVQLEAAGSVANLGTVKLATDVITVGGITASAMRSAVTVGVDRNIYSTKNMPAAEGGTTTDLLRNVPELDVDVDGNVKLQGSQSVALHINGRPAPMRGDALKNFLQMLPANRVERVEIIPNPSAKYDPEGIAGIVNIVLKDNVDLGLSGSLSVNGDSRGRDGVNGNLNYQKGKLTLFGNLGFNLNSNSMHLLDLRENLLASPVTYFSNDVHNDQGGHFIFFDSSVEYKLSKLNTAFASARIMSADVSMTGLQQNQILDANKAVMLWYDWNNDNSFSFNNSDVSLGIRRVVKPQQNELTGEVRYTGNGNDQNQNYIKSFLTAVGEPTTLPDENGLTDANTGVGEYSAKIDYTRQLNPKYKLDAGYKGAARGTDYTNVLQRSLAGSSSPFSEQHSDYSYDENYQQAYALLSRQINKIGVQVGARGEVASTDFQLPSGSSYENSYQNLFPSLNVSYTKSQGFSARFAYSKRVDRPQPNMLNPGQPSADSLNIFVGNPSLKPKYTHAFTADFTHMASWGMLKFSPYYRVTTNNWDYFKDVDANGVSTLTWKNTKSVTQFSTNATVSYRMGSKATGFVSFNAYDYKRDASNLDTSYSADGFRWDVSANGMATVRKGLMLQGFVRYTAPQDLPQGTIKQGAFSNIGFRQQLKGNQLTLSGAVVDPLNVFHFRFETHDVTHTQVSENHISIRSFRLSLTYNFGKPPTPTVKKDNEQQQVDTSQPQIR